MRRLGLRSFLIVSAGLCLAGCGPPELSEIDGARSMTDLSVEGHRVNIDELAIEPVLTIGASKRTVEGTGGCNDFAGRFTYVNGTMEPEDVYFTIVGCSESIETEVDAALQGLLSGPFEVAGDAQTLELSGNGVVATFARVED